MDLFLGFTYQGFCWYLGDADASCDDTCASNGAANEAVSASNVIQDDDCTLIDHYNSALGLGLANKGSTPFWSFGYYYADTGANKYCSKMSGTVNAGVRIGEENGSSTRRLVCPCTGKGMLKHNLICENKQKRIIFSFFQKISLVHIHANLLLSKTQ